MAIYGSIIYGVGEFSLMPIFPQKNSDIFKIPVKLSHHNKFIRAIRKCQLSLLIISQIPLELQIKILLFQKRGVKKKSYIESENLNNLGTFFKTIIFITAILVISSTCYI